MLSTITGTFGTPDCFANLQHSAIGVSNAAQREKTLASGRVHLLGLDDGHPLSSGQVGQLRRSKNGDTFLVSETVSTINRESSDSYALGQLEVVRRHVGARQICVPHQ